jgi:hypothetical protein
MIGKLAGKRWTTIFSIIVFGLTVIGCCGSSLAYYATGTYDSGTYGSCQYGVACSISLSSNGNLSLNVTPSTSGSCTIQSDSASVLTDDSDGYSLTLSDSSTNTSLINGSNSISATSGSYSSPTALSGNSWGYRVDGQGSFGSGPTTSQTNSAHSSTVFASIKSNLNTAETIATSSTAADPAITTKVWYGACANTSVASGTYSSQVIYTAVAN